MVFTGYENLVGAGLFGGGSVLLLGMIERLGCTLKHFLGGFSAAYAAKDADRCGYACDAYSYGSPHIFFGGIGDKGVVGALSEWGEMVAKWT